MTGLPFCGTELAAQIERAEAQLIAAGTDAARGRNPDIAFVVPVACGAACFAEAGSPFNKVVGLGFGGVPSAVVLEEIERSYAARGAATQVELCHLADPEIGAMLTGRGYRLVSFEDVLGRSLAPGETWFTPGGLTARLSGDDEFDAWVEVVTSGFAHPDEQGVSSHEDFPRAIVERAERDFVAAGGGACG